MLFRSLFELANVAMGMAKLLWCGRGKQIPHRLTPARNDKGFGPGGGGGRFSTWGARLTPSSSLALTSIQQRPNIRQLTIQLS